MTGSRLFGVCTLTIKDRASESKDPVQLASTRDGVCLVSWGTLQTQCGDSGVK